MADTTALLRDRLRDGGRVLIIRNTVKRAQAEATRLERAFPGEVALLHSRLRSGDRAERTSALLEALGRANAADATRRIVVSTQVAEQSFDVDVDLLVTDLAPIDLVLQRVGRMHRHAERDPHRPSAVIEPEVIVGGYVDHAQLEEVRADDRRAIEALEGAFPYGIGKIYSPLLLVRTLAQVQSARGRGWRIPSDIPSLVRSAYEGGDEIVPMSWRDAAEVALRVHAQREDDSRGRARTLRLGGDVGSCRATLDGLHRLASGARDDVELERSVRDGLESVEVLLLRRVDGDLVTVDGQRISRGGALSLEVDVVEAVSTSLIRLPAGEDIADAARRELAPEPTLGALNLLGQLPVLWLGDDLTGQVGSRRWRYDPFLGLVDA